MVGAEFLDFVNKLHVTDYIGVEDFADKLSFIYSVLVLMLCTVIITAKQYLMSAIACYIPTVPSGSDFEKFLENFCWVHGTIPILANESIPQTSDEWSRADHRHRINYYQWVPFMLGLQCMLFYLPRIIWQVICYNRTGTDLEHLIHLANKAEKSGLTDRKQLITHIAYSIRTMLFQHREYRDGKIITAKQHLFEKCGILVVSKRLGTWLVFTYLIIKLLYLLNSVGQLYLMQYFLGFNETLSNFGVELTSYMIGGHSWQKTRLFPRVSYCYLNDIRHLGSVNQYIAQCVLPVNMLNEKLYIFLWFWTALVAICTAITIPVWLLRLTILQNRLGFVKRYLCLNKQFHSKDKQLLRKFIQNHLKHDGVFLLRMIALNVGDIITSEVVSNLWKNYRKDELEILNMDNNNDDNNTNSLKSTNKDNLLELNKLKKTEV